MSLPKPKPLPQNFQQPVCEKCFALGREVRYMEVIVGRSMDDDHALLWYSCRSCGHLTSPSPVPLFYMAASSLNELEQIIAAHDLAGHPASKDDLSPGAQRVVEEYSLNPFVLAEAAAMLAIKYQQTKELVTELEQRLSTESG